MLTDTELRELEARQKKLYAEFEASQKLHEQVRDRWLAVARLVDLEQGKRKILAEMRASGEIPQTKSV